MNKVVAWQWCVDATVVAEFSSKEEAEKAFEELPDPVSIQIGSKTLEVPKKDLSVVFIER